MEANANVSDRIKAILQHYGLNANSVTARLGYSTTSKMYKILQGAEPSFPTLVDFLKEFPDISSDWLMLEKGPMLRGEAPDAVAKLVQPQRAMTSPEVLTVTVDATGEENTLLVPLSVQAGYPAQFNEAVYLSDMKPYHLPGFERGTYRAFEVEGVSMSPTFGHRDIVVCSYVDRWDLLKPWECYVVVTAENLLLKRIGAVITDRRGTFELHSDNSGYDSYRLPVADLLQLWQVRGYISTSIPARPSTSPHTMERLQEVIELLGHDYHEVRKFLEESARDRV
jgi:phage repressor protein C with HTH and peptisase S24 domain